jgi:hypothetical protein
MVGEDEDEDEGEDGREAHRNISRASPSPGLRVTWLF